MKRFSIVAAAIAMALGTAAQAQESNLVGTREQRLQRAEMREQHGRGARADAGHAWDVVHRVPGQREIVGDLVRLHAQPLPDAGAVPARVAWRVPLFVVIADELAEILVGGHDHAAIAMATRHRERAADEVVGLVVLVGQHPRPQRVRDRLAGRELAHEVGRRGRPVGLVGRVQRMPERTAQRLVERDREVGRPRALDQFEQEAGEAMHRVHGRAIGIEHVGPLREPSPAHVQACIDEMDDPAHTGDQSDTTSARPGRRRSGAGSRALPTCTKPTTRSCSARPSSAATSRS